ncbi:unnamed protein product [Linum tenue]|uniref:Uncharacterized protein n=1 Tax=Linum tenue TaxID=586396 RepID=A0AAV0PP19_9ROSI|nr:unnamed protein product [Linum tenue]CAI0472307.1 unnamed protein product [Linum tenue]
MRIGATPECRTRTRTGSSTYGLGRLLSLLSPGSIPTCGISLTSSTVGTTRHSYLSSITGRKLGPRISPTNLSGTSTWTRTTEIRIITTGRTTSLRLCLSCFDHCGEWTIGVVASRCSLRFAMLVIVNLNTLNIVAS